MSKAFVKEDSDSEADSEVNNDSSSAIPSGTKNYMTPQGAARLKAELHELLVVARPELVKTISWAASNGDRSENGDYIYGKRRLREVDRRIRFLTKRLDQALIVDPTQTQSDRVLFGAFVETEDESGKRERYQIVGIDETDVQKKKISWISPMAKALMQAKVGDVVTVRLPQGERELEILKIEYPRE